MKVVRIKIKASTGEERIRTREISNETYESLLAKLNVKENGYTLTELKVLDY